MKKEISNTSKMILNTPAEKEMLQKVIDNMKDKELFLEKKASILACVDPEKSKEGELIVSFK